MSELSADAKALIERSRLDDGPSAHDKQRMRTKLATQLGASAFTAGGSDAAAGSASNGASFLRSGLVRWFASVAAIGGLSLGAYLIAAPHDASRVPSAKVAPPMEPPAQADVGTPSEAPASAPVAVTEAAPPAAEPAAKQAEPTKKTTRPPRAKRNSAATFQPVGSSATMSAEIALLSQAQKALRARDGQQALRLAQQHAQNFPNGALYEERVGIEAIAHCILGERQHPAVRAFLSRAPRSPLSARVRKECDLP